MTFLLDVHEAEALIYRRAAPAAASGSPAEAQARRC